MTRNAEAVPNADIVVLAVKPQMLRSVMREVGPALEKGQVVLSIVAGATLRTPPGSTTRPWCAPCRTRRPRSGAASPCGPPHRPAPPGSATLRDRSCAPSARRRSATSVRGHGHSAIGDRPTYLFAVMEALIDAGVHMGFPRELAHDLVVETLIGSAEYAAQSELHPAQLRNAVTSPGGTSAAAIYELEKGRIRTVLSDAVWAAYRRTQELGERLGRRPALPARTGAGGTVRQMFAIVMAGGVGTRLWPLSRRRSPKQLLALTGDTSLLQQSVARLGTLPSRTTSTSSPPGARARHPGAAAAAAADNVLGEPLARSTAVAAGLATVMARRVRRGRPGAAGRPLPGRRGGVHRTRCARPSRPPSAATS